MSRLCKLYEAMETLRNEGLSLNEDLEKQINELEKEIIKNEILPIIIETIEPALEQVKRELVIVVDYVPDMPISVHLSRKLNFTKGIPDAKEILPDPKVGHKDMGRRKQKVNLSPATRLKITFEDGTIIYESNAIDTLCKFIEYVGIERVRSLGLTQCYVPLISNTIDLKYKNWQRPIGNGWYVMAKNNTQRKKKNIELIAEAFDIKIKVDIL